jgi:hypothetical protein
MIKYNPKQSTTNVDTLINQVNSESGLKIDINPEYQRDVIWEETRQSFFIDSIMKGIAPMPILLCMNEEGTNKICMDGKQRLTSLVRFKQNKLKWNDTYFRDLGAKEQTYFLNCSIHSIEYDTLSYDEQKEIFSRIQHGKALSDGEKIISVFDKDTAVRFKKMCDNLYTEKLSKFKKIKSDRDSHYIFMACVVALLITNNNNNLANKEKLEPVLKNNFSNNEKQITEFMNIVLSDKLLLNSKIIDNYKKIETNRLVIVINEIYKESKINKKFLSNKSNEILDIVTRFFDKANEETNKEDKKIGAGRTKKILDELLRLYNKAKNNEPDTESDKDSESESKSESENESEKESESESENIQKKKIIKRGKPKVNLKKKI